MSITLHPKTKQQGFTVVELLIATSIFTVVLLLATFAVIQIGKTYYKGLNSISTQDTARAIVDEMSQSIQFKGSTVNQSGPYTGGYYCVSVGPTRYFYLLETQLVKSSPSSNQSTQVFLTDKDVKGCPLPADWAGLPATADRELMGLNMRLSKLTITPDSTNQLYKIAIRIVFGDNDLLCSPIQGNCNDSSITNFGSLPADLSCKSGAGSQYCASSELTTTVEKRI